MAQFLILTFRVQADHTLAGLPDVGQEQLEQIALTLTGIAQDQDVGCGLILRAPVKIHEDIGSILISADIQSLGIGLAGKIEGIQVGHRAGWQHTLELGAKLIAAHRQHGEEAFLLPQSQPIHRDFGTGQFHGNIGLQFLQRIQVFCLHLQEHRAVEQRLLVLAEIRQQLNDILKVALRLNGFVHVIAAGFQLVAPGGVLHDFPLLHAFHQPVINAQGHTAAIRKLCQNRLFLRGGRIISISGIADSTIMRWRILISILT